MSNQYQQNNYRKMRGEDKKPGKKGECGCKHDKKMSGFVDTGWFKILGKGRSK
jgi:hypothetical protein